MTLTFLRRWLPALALLLAPLSAAAARDDFRDRQLTRGVFAEGQLWLLTASGDLFRIAERTGRRFDEDLPDPVLDICRRDGEVLAVTGRRWEGGSWALRRHVRGAWRIVGRAARRDDGFLAMDCNAGPVTLLTSGRIVEMRPEGAAAIALAGAVPPARVASTLHGTRAHLYVGINSGEWGRGLHRIDRASGAVVAVGDDAEGGACDGPLDAICGPVHAIVQEPWRPGCLAVAVGLVHFFSSGGLVEVCGDRVEQLYSKPATIGVEAAGEAPRGTVAFFGLARIGDTLRAVGTDGAYRIGARGAVEFARFPPFRRVGGVELSFELPDAVLVVTEVNRRASVSVGAPMIVAR